MKIFILLLSGLLFCLEWYVVRHTSIKFYVPIVTVFFIALPIGLFYGLHLVTAPMLFMVLGYVFCRIEEELRNYFRRKTMTEEEKSRLKDL